MEDNIDTLHRPLNHLDVRHIADDDLGILVHLLTGGKIVEDSNARASREKRIDKM